MLEQKDTINGFNEEMARFLVKNLLESDCETYKNLIPQIDSLNSEDFYNLFKGIKYEHDDLYKQDFDDLVLKFNNFSKIINNFYKEPKYYSALKDLWINNVCIEDLGQNAEKSEDFIKKIKSLTDKYEEWPKDFQNDFYKLVKNTKNTKIYQLKEKFEKEYNSYYQLTKELIKLKHYYKKESEEKQYEKASDNILNGIISAISIIYTASNFLGYTDKIFEKAKAAKGLLAKQEVLSYIDINLIDSNSNFTPMQIFNGLKKTIENDVGEQSYILNVNCFGFEWVKSTEDSDYNSYKCCLDPRCEAFTVDGDIKCPEVHFLDEFRSFLEDELSSYGILIASFLNLGWSFMNFREIEKDFKKLNEYDKNLEEIRSDFYGHKNLMKDLPNKIEEAIEYINNILSYIKQDIKRLDDHIKNIQNDIEKQKSMQNKSLIGIGISVVLGGLSLAKTFFGGGGIINMVSIGTNLFSGTQHFVNYEKSEDLIKEFGKRMDKAIELSNEINAFIDKMVEELEKKKKKDIYKFNDFVILDKKFEEVKKKEPETTVVNGYIKNDKKLNIIDNYF